MQTTGISQVMLVWTSSKQQTEEEPEKEPIGSSPAGAMTTKHHLIQLSKPRLSGPPSYRPAWLLAMGLLLALVSMLLVGEQRANALNCYHCSSVDNPECDEPFTGRANFTDTDCEKAIGQPAKVCRKLVQYIEHKKVVIRSCGYIDEHDEKDRKSACLKRSGTFAIMMESCNCYTENCNYSASLVPTKSVLFPLTVLLVILNLVLNSRQKPVTSTSNTSSNFNFIDTKSNTINS